MGWRSCGVFRASSVLVPSRRSKIENSYPHDGPKNHRPKSSVQARASSPRRRHCSARLRQRPRLLTHRADDHAPRTVKLSPSPPPAGAGTARGGTLPADSRRLAHPAALGHPPIGLPAERRPGSSSPRLHIHSLLSFHPNHQSAFFGYPLQQRRARGASGPLSAPPPAAPCLPLPQRREPPL